MKCKRKKNPEKNIIKVSSAVKVKTVFLLSYKSDAQINTSVTKMVCLF